MQRATEAAAIGERYGDPDLVTIARMGQGHALVRQGRTEEGFRLVDETMVAVTTGELSPIVAGIVYCNTIAFCQDAHDVRRAREWTDALTEWCDRQPDMVAHTGVCLVHRAEVMQLQGAWRAALEEVQRAGERLRQGVLNQRIAGSALYRQGEIQRLQGEFAAAEEAYRAASRLGFEPQPGLALLRLAQGNGAAAAAAIGRVADETEEPLKRAGLLPACVEIMLAVGDLEEARRASGELDAISETHASDLLRALAAHAGGAVALAEGDARAALGSLRRALSTWQDIEAPYEAARTRVLLGMACRRLGDDDAAALELEAARAVFEELGAGPDLTRVDSLVTSAPSKSAHGLSPRELRGAAPRRGRQDQQGDRDRARPQREDRRAARQQHLRQARRLDARSSHRVRLRAPAPLSGITHSAGRRKLGGFSEVSPLRVHLPSGRKRSIRPRRSHEPGI